ncbi:hypothetical protein ACV36C_34525 [Pseudomonas aeruginosa]
MNASPQYPTVADLLDRHKRTTAELAEVRVELAQERLRHAYAVTALGNAAHALEQGTPVPEVLRSIRLALGLIPRGVA